MVWVIKLELKSSQVTVCAPGNVGGQWVHTNTWAMKVYASLNTNVTNVIVIVANTDIIANKYIVVKPKM